jgi:3-methyl-2-oxobutanoate hydroxymethyltransferase
MPITITELRARKERGERFTMLTAYDALTARLLDEAGVPVLLVGDSLAQVILGYDSTLPVTMDEMLHHTRAVARGSRNALVVGDMPFGSFQAGVDEAMRNAFRFLKEAGAHAVKLEGAHLDLVRRLVDAGVPVMGHLGLTPQSVNQFGGYKVQGRTEEAANRILLDAKAIEEAGAFALVLECVPADLATRITASLSIPTIGIGAGAGCDAQVLVIQDLLGLTPTTPRFVKRYAEVGATLVDAAQAFITEVAAGTYPDAEHSYR